MIAGVVVAALLVVAVLVELAPGRGPSPAPRPMGTDRRDVGASRGRSRGSSRGARPAGRRWPGGTRAVAPDVAGVMTEVAARLRAGGDVQDAWARALERAGLDAGDLEGEPASGRASRSLAAELAAVRLAVRLAEGLGAPLAAVLDRCALGVAAAGRAESARRVALAGPASTARLLTALPVAGLLVGTALGADPVATLLDGGPGTAAALAGLGLLVLGHRWTSVLVAAARDAGSDGASG